jgi:hypothetical protein
MYNKCKCCVSIVALQQTTNMGEFHKLVTKIKSNQNTKDKTRSFVIHNNVVREVNRTAVDLTTEETYNPSNIMYRLHRFACKGIHHQIHTVDVVADMLAFNVFVIAKNKSNTVVAFVRTIKSDGPTCTIDWHKEMVKYIRRGDSEFTDTLNRRCQRYYTPQVTEKSVEGKEVCEIPPPVPSTKESHIQPSQSTQKRKSYVDHPSNEKRKTHNPGYTSGPYKKRLF